MHTPPVNSSIQRFSPLKVSKDARKGLEASIETGVVDPIPSAGRDVSCAKNDRVDDALEGVQVRQES